MTTTDIIAVISIIISFTAAGYTWLTNTKKYELTSIFRKELLEWYDKTLSVLVLLRILTDRNCLTPERKCELLSELSKQIELGRFYFPNVDTGDCKDAHKPIAYRGHRHVALEFLVFIYDIYNVNNLKAQIEQAYYLQRHFTSYIFSLLRPVDFNKQIKKNTTLTFNTEKVLSEYIQNNLSLRKTL
jgi:hypothetical protein